MFLFSILLFSSYVEAQDLTKAEPFQFKVGDEIFIQADKFFTEGDHKVYRAVGNVVINHFNENLYGESAYVNRETMEIRIVGNVRYITQDLTLYGSELKYNIKTSHLEIHSARLISNDYTIIGEQITRLSDGSYEAKEAEYSTCRDCPESWTLLGGDVKLYPGQYIHIKHTMIKIKGIAIMYFPFITIPIKKNRETGLLFPRIGIQQTLGMTYQQPWFWAISSSNDLTLTPSIYGRRGGGGEVEYRQVFGESKWTQIESMGLFDRIYVPNQNTDKVSGHHYNRNFSVYEHHFQLGNYLTHHFHGAHVRELDMFKDFHEYASARTVGSEIGFNTFFDFRSSLFDFNSEAHFGRNLLVRDAREFDQRYVQILPRLSLSFAPMSLVRKGPWGMRKLLFGAENTFTVFKQNHFLEQSGLRRNAQRTTTNPYLIWQVGSIGPVQLKSRIEMDHQHYSFAKVDEHSFSKTGTIFTTDMSLEVDKILGLSYVEDLPVDRVRLEEIRKAHEQEKRNSQSDSLVGDLPAFEESYTEDYVKNVRNSYRHSQIFRLVHYYTSNQKFYGNKDFLGQIKLPQNLFDYEDAIRAEENTIGTNFARTLISTKNSIEFQWNNSLIKKSPKNFDIFHDERYLIDNFSYHKIAYFNVSQAIRLNTHNPDWTDDLERLHLEGRFTLGKWSFGASEYFYYQNGEHQVTADLGLNFDRFNSTLSYEYNPFATPGRRFLALSGQIRPVDSLLLNVGYQYDMEKKRRRNAHYGIVYMPANNCWRFEVNYQDNDLQKKVGIDFTFNFSDNRFQSFKGGGNGPS